VPDLTQHQEAENVTSEVIDQVLVVILNRPDKRNAIDGACTSSLRSIFDRFESDDRLRAAVITGAGGYFCAGADLGAGFRGETIMDEHGFASFTKRLRTKPVIAAVEGPAYAGGFEIALAADMIVAGDSATFCLPEVKRGVMAGSGCYRLQAQLPHATARYLALIGDPISAGRAFTLGLVSELVSDGDALESAIVLADRIADYPEPSVKETLTLLRSTVNLDEPKADQISRQCLKRLSGTPEFGIGATRFGAKN
jgi:enoyl-CoA hydratase/carnithine racemase